MEKQEDGKWWAQVEGGRERVRRRESGERKRRNRRRRRS